MVDEDEMSGGEVIGKGGYGEDGAPARGMFWSGGLLVEFEFDAMLQWLVVLSCGGHSQHYGIGMLKKHR